MARVYRGLVTLSARLGANVGASLLAKNSQAPHIFRMPALSLRFFASKLAPTGVSNKNFTLRVIS
ncbi:hypothetical protein PflCFBP13510_16700 [Pseudomonas fluorescens]|nr:hypothetical protein PflCFBP13510_16700 [Pseudomonas fluorescens]